MLTITFLGIQLVSIVVEYTIAYLIWILFPRGNRTRVVEVIVFSTSQQEALKIVGIMSNIMRRLQWEVSRGICRQTIKRTFETPCEE